MDWEIDTKVKVIYVKEETVDPKDIDMETHDETNMKMENVDVKKEALETVDQICDCHLKDIDMEETYVKKEDVDVKEQTVDQRVNDFETNEETYEAEAIKVKEEVDDEHEANILQDFRVKDDDVQDFEDDIEIKEEEIKEEAGVIHNSKNGPSLESDTLNPVQNDRIMVENQAERNEEVSNDNDEPPPLVSDVDEVAASEFVRKMKSTFSKYSPFAVFNAVKTELCWKMPPSLQLTDAGEKMALVLCANASGDFKLRPACVIKEEHNTIPSEDLESLPVWFAATESGEIDDGIFIQWYSEEFIPKVSEYLRKKSLPLKVLLLLDDSYSRLSDTFQLHGPNFKVVFFPPKTAALIQPLTQPDIVSEFTKAFRGSSELSRSSSTPHACADQAHKSSSAVKPSPSPVPNKTNLKIGKDAEISSKDCDASQNKKCKGNQRKITNFLKKRC